MVADKVGLTDKIQAMVDAANAALQQIKTATAAKNGSTAAARWPATRPYARSTRRSSAPWPPAAGSLGSPGGGGISLLSGAARFRSTRTRSTPRTPLIR
jgi:hypothetical protein